MVGRGDGFGVDCWVVGRTVDGFLEDRLKGVWVVSTYQEPLVEGGE